MKKRPIFSQLIQRLQEPRKFIQVLLGPRQVGKTTLAMQVAKEIQIPSHYVSADIATLQGPTWLHEQWETARLKIDHTKGALLIIDEVQKIADWSNLVKYLWDQDTQNNVNLYVMILGSSPWLMQKGLTESLAGRFEVLPITHWSFPEMRDTFGWSLDKYIYFGGYPGAAPLVDENDVTRWKNYINDSLIETTISKDVLLMSQVNKPVLLHRLFQLGCQYSGQIVSYSKMLGHLHDAGNATTLAHYLELLSGAGLLTGLQKFYPRAIGQKGSIPKLAVYNTALMSTQSSQNYLEAKKDTVFWGRLVESTVGAHILNSIRGTTIQCYYWREGDKEVDFVLQRDDSITAIEVKSSAHSMERSAMHEFAKKFHPNRMLVVGGQGIPLENFLSAPITNFI